ncbi:DMT family transporter [Ichthyenterobacterium magnum]|uniref:EamA domain-containing membrane protein RarD n=1 Tax=Ichthyenterobacterium magnum TaxID=1230530 RepID=A0A420DXP9_9FLAO|nr:DMT family transporter [Ichthyenterobacterium magnum]RKE98993.1 EamA domain-containing membrane protein RarD [Ichthyenterobacterium magnum]
MNSRKFALIALFLVQLLYGLNYTFAKIVINENYVKPFAFVLLRVGGAMVLFWLLGIFFKKEKIDKKDYLTFLLAAVFGVAINMLLFLKGLELTTPIHASVIVTITPILILIFSSFFLKEKITRLKILGVFLGFSGGILLTVLGKSIRVGDNVPLGNLFIFINAISYSIYIIIIKKLTAKYHPFTFIKWLFLFGFFLVLPFAYTETTQIEWQTFTPYIWFSVAFVVVGATFGTYMLNPLALRSLKASTVGVFIYLQPVIAGVFAIIMGIDAVSPIKIAAMCLIFLGVYLVTKKPKA